LAESSFLRRSSSVRRFAVILAVLWTLGVFLGAGISIRQTYRSTLESVRLQASQSFEKDLLYRRWAADHGGVYVPATDQTPPNPYLENLANRDITVDGVKFTLVNPAYMTRQVFSLGLERLGQQGHITSLDPLRPENAPDPWEAEALAALGEGATEVVEVLPIGEDEYLRLMRPLPTEESCLKCHAEQGYEVGDVRGGISITVPMKEHWTVAYDQAAATGLGYGLVWIVGLSSIGIASSRLGRQISRRTRAEERATSLGAVLEQSMNEIYVFDPHTLKFLDVNEGGRRNLGYSIDEFRELTPLDLKRDISLQRFEEILSPLRTGEKLVVDFTATHTRMNGSTYPVEVHLQLLTFMSKPAFIAIILDVSERVRAREERQRFAAQIQQTQKLESIGTLASGVAHEINNPLMGILNYAELVKDKVIDPKAVAYLVEIDKEGRRIARIVSNLLSFARQDTEGRALSNLRDIVDASLTLIGSVLRRSQITVTVDLPEDLPEVMCRRQQIQQVVINLFTNANDALNERYPDYDENKTIRVSASTSKKDGANWIRLSIEDQGAGIPDDVVPRIFDPFYTTKDRAEGTGLGLAVSFGIVREHQGELTVESEPSQLTRFHIDLPMDSDGSKEPPQNGNREELQ
jgi:PAS domain S-box-containing protein